MLFSQTLHVTEKYSKTF